MILKAIKWRWGLALLVLGLCAQALFMYERIAIAVAETLVNVLYMNRESVSDVLLLAYWLFLPLGYLSAIMGSWIMKSPTAVVVAHSILFLGFASQLLIIVTAAFQ